MLDEYFALQIDEDARLTALPLVLPGYTPNFDVLPTFLLRLVFKVCAPRNEELQTVKLRFRMSRC
jgi:hypothetical protein